MLPTDEAYGGWAASGEIDIMEAINQVEEVHGTLHYGGSWPNNTSTTASYTDATADFSADYHVYALEWEPGAMRWYVDGTLYATQDEWHSTEAAFPAPFDRRFHLLVNLAVGGNWPGPPDETTTFPQEFRIDWIRVSPLEP
jgi:beta-glucanase (GH16 family)